MKNKGFTLIELVVVIVILGILAITAAPHFLNVQRDARIAALNGFKGAFYAADGIVTSKAMTAGIENAMYDTEIPNTGIFIRQGAMSLNAKNIAAAMETDGFTLTDRGTTDMPSVIVTFDNNEINNGLPRERCALIISRGVTTASYPKPLMPLKIYFEDKGC